jgi:hypothetical protein
MLRDLIAGAKDLTRNPLGVIGLFIVMVYSFACLLFGLNGKNLTPQDHMPLVWFVVLFPCLVLWTFYCLVTKHHNKLYAPRDFRDEKNFLAAGAAPQPAPTQAETSPLIVTPTNETNVTVATGMATPTGDIQVALSRQSDSPILVAQLNEMAGPIQTSFNSMNPGTRISDTLRILALAHIVALNERTYRLIYGSQLNLLNKIKLTGTALRREAEEVYLRAKVNYSDLYDRFNVTFDSWIAFLIDRNLCERQNDGSLSLTPHGEGFIQFMHEQNISFEKLL